MSYKRSLEEVINDMKSSVNGLSTDEANSRLQNHGYNEIKEGKKVPLWLMFLETFKDPLVIILLISVVVQIFLGEFIESIIIIIVVLLNSVLGVSQTRKAESSLDSLKKLSSPNTKVLRNQEKITIPFREVVKGDIVFLEAGDYIPADGRLIEAESLKIVEGILTGEAEAVLKHTDPLVEDVGLGDRRNMVFSGSTVVYGRGKLVVTSIGMNTEMGKVAELLESAGNKQTPLQMKLDDFGKKLGIIIMALSALIFVIQVFRGYLTGVPMEDLLFKSFMFAIAVAVAAIPEALSSIVTIVLAVGTKEMARKQAIVRKLPAVETLGSASVICTDKTGTLTQNKMTVVDFYMYGSPRNGEQVEAIDMSSTLCNDSDITKSGEEIGDPTEIALLKFAEKRGINYKVFRERYDRLSEIPFDSHRKMMSTVNSIDGNALMFTKGAPDVVISRCKKCFNHNEIVEIDELIKENYRKQMEVFSSKALRVLAFAVKDVPDENFVPAVEDEDEMILIGLMALIDPPRKEVFGAIKQSKGAGIKTIMITGDHKTTAVAIAKEIGIMNDENYAFTGKELDEMSEDELGVKLEQIRVFARVSPENKIRIVKAWQKKGFVTAMTGDGVNDAPSLKQADIGIAMGSGTDVAKDASAMVLTDDNFATIVSAIEVGRTVYSNIKKSIAYLLAGNLGAIIAIVFAVLVNWPAPFTALQLLFINLINDSLPAIALGLEPAELNIMDQKPRNLKEGILGGGTWQSVIVRGILIGVGVILAQYLGDETSPILGTAMAFATVTLTRIFQTLPARSDRYTIFKIGVFKNLYVWSAIGVCTVVFMIVTIPGVRKIFDIPDAFGIGNFGICLGISIIVALIMDLSKLLKRTYKS